MINFHDLEYYSGFLMDLHTKRFFRIQSIINFTFIYHPETFLILVRVLSKYPIKKMGLINAKYN